MNPSRGLLFKQLHKRSMKKFRLRRASRYFSGATTNWATKPHVVKTRQLWAFRFLCSELQRAGYFNSFFQLSNCCSTSVPLYSSGSFKFFNTNEISNRTLVSKHFPVSVWFFFAHFRWVKQPVMGGLYNPVILKYSRTNSMSRGNLRTLKFPFSFLSTPSLNWFTSRNTCIIFFFYRN